MVAIDRTSKFAYVELHQRATKMIAAEFVRHLIAAVPYAIHIVLTDNGIQFKNREQDRTAMEHIFGRLGLSFGRQLGVLEGMGIKVSIRIDKPAWRKPYVFFSAADLEQYLAAKAA